MSVNAYLIGGRVVVIGTCCVVLDPLADPDPVSGIIPCTPTDPTTVVFKRKINNQAVVPYTNGSPEVSKLAVGFWACVVDVDTDGKERWRFEASGACHAAAETVFTVLESDLA